MCKHILVNNFRSSDLKLIRGFASKTHDKDGFGFIARLKNRQIVTGKSLNPGAFYIDLVEIVNSGRIQTLVVHHRTSTNFDGIEYAHPFEYQGNYLTHNGVVQVPGEHQTQTRNDSEALLHHLVKTGYETESIRGYFSCFILNSNETIVLADSLAPMYSDGRVYCSHKLSDHFKAMQLERRVLDPKTGSILSKKAIKVTESNYGYASVSKSIGYWDDAPKYESDFSMSHLTQTVEQFINVLTINDERRLEQIEGYSELYWAIQEIADERGVPVSEDDIDQLLELYAA